MEEWRKIEGFNYSVSSEGRVRNDKTGRIKAPVKDDKGYVNARLYCDGVGTYMKIHRLVGEAFIENPENKAEINHKDFNKTNNNVENLEWATHQENVAHASINGRMKMTPRTWLIGHSNPNGGRKGRAVILVDTGEVFKNALEASRRTGVSDTRILACAHGETRTTRIGVFRFYDEYEDDTSSMD